MMSVDNITGSCEHYSRKCKLVTPCCNNVYSCYQCHDERENHKLDRAKVKLVVCLQCETRQEVSRHCKNCSAIFGKYFCNICNLFDDRDTGQFHCPNCGICRKGGRNNFFHCPKCDVCYSKDLLLGHRCIEKSSRNDCAVCLEDLHTSIIPSHVPKCGHLLHQTCFNKLIESGMYKCPTCKKCLLRMSDVWLKKDAVIAETPISDEHTNLAQRQREVQGKISNLGMQSPELQAGITVSDMTLRDELLRENKALIQKVRRLGKAFQHSKLDYAKLYGKFREVSADLSEILEEVRASHEEEKRNFEREIQQLLAENNKMKKIIGDLQEIISKDEIRKAKSRLGQIGIQLDVLVAQFIFPGEDRDSKRARYGFRLKCAKEKIEKIMDEKAQEEARRRLDLLDDEIFEDWFLDLVEDLKKIGVSSVQLGSYQEMEMIINEEMKDDNVRRKDTLSILHHLNKMYELLEKQFGK